MYKLALPRPIGATVSVLLALIGLVMVLPATGQAAPPSSGSPLAATSTAFPKTTVGGASEKLTIELSNAVEEDLALQSFAVEGEDAADFTVNEFNCGFLSPAASCTVGISFSPQRVGEEHATLRLDLWNLPSEYVELSGTGVAAELTFSPASYDFGIQSTHENANFTFQLTNSGEAGAQLGNIEIPNPGGNVPFWTGNSNCWSLNRLEPGQSCSLEVQFGPREAIPYSGELRASLNQTAFSAALSGEGGHSQVEATENPADLGTATVGGVGPIRTITLTNSGNLPAGFFIGIIAGGDSGSFQLLDENCSGAELMPSATCTVHIRLIPQSPGPKVARLAFFGDGEDGAMVMLHGEGIAPAVTLAPSAYDFGSQAAGSSSAAHAFAVVNEGAAPIELDSVAIVGANPDQFSLAGDECSGESLAPAAECLVRVRFAPESAGAKTATLRIRGNAGSFTASLSGSAGPVAPPAGSSATASTTPVARHSGSGRRRRFVRRHTVRDGHRPHRTDLRGGVVSR